MDWFNGSLCRQEAALINETHNLLVKLSAPVGTFLIVDHHHANLALLSSCFMPHSDNLPLSFTLRDTQQLPLLLFYGDLVETSSGASTKLLYTMAGWY